MFAEHVLCILCFIKLEKSFALELCIYTKKDRQSIDHLSSNANSMRFKD